MVSMKKVGAIVLTVVMSAASISGLACGNDRFIGYDQTADQAGNYAKLYDCPLEGKVIVKGYASKVEYEHAYYEAAYPHKEVATLVLDGVNTGRTVYTGAVANAKTQLKPDFWETKYPYNVYHRLYSSLNGGAYRPSNEIGFAGVTANVQAKYATKGFDKYIVDQGVVKDFSLVYGENADKVSGTLPWGQLEQLAAQYYDAVSNDGVFTEAFMEGKEYGAYDMFTNVVSKYDWLQLEGPLYANGGTTTVVPFDRIANGAPSQDFDNVLAVEGNAAPVKWVTMGYELTAPYRYYQVLEVNGVLMDGREVELVNSPAYISGYQDVKAFDKDNADQIAVKDQGSGYDIDSMETPDGDTVVLRKAQYAKDSSSLPYIFRYTGGTASPKVEWKTAFPEAEYPYAIYERKFVDGKATNDLRPTGEFAHALPEIYSVSNNPRQLRIKLSGNKMADQYIQDKLLEQGYEFYVGENGGFIVVNVVPETLYLGHNNYFDQDRLEEFIQMGWDAATLK